MYWANCAVIFAIAQLSCFILPLIAMLNKESKMRQPDAFCERTTQQNAAASAVELTALPDPMGMP